MRDLFDLPREIAYFDTAAKGLLAAPCAAALQSAQNMMRRPWEPAALPAAEASETVRVGAAKLFGAEADDIALVRSVGSGVALALASLSMQRGQTVLRLAGDHPSIGLQAGRAANRAGADELVVPDTGGDWTEAILAMMAEAGSLAAMVLTPAFWTDGRPIDLEIIAAAARSSFGQEDQPALIIDATHTAGVTPETFVGIAPDFIVFPAFKWLLGPAGLAFLIAAPHRQSGEPADRNGFNSLTNADYGFAEFRVGARRYDMGQRDAPMQMLHAAAAFDLVGSLDRAALLDGLTQIAQQISNHAIARGMMVAGGQAVAPHLLGLALPGVEPSELAGRMREHGVIVSPRGRGVRVSPYLHNDDEDVARLLGAIDVVANDLSPGTSAPTRGHNLKEGASVRQQGVQNR